MPPGEPAPVPSDAFARLHRAVDEAIGTRLFTVMSWSPARRVLRREYSSHPAEYPVGGEKSVEVSGDWLRTCVEEGRPFLGPDRATLESVFADHELIDRLGCQAVINLPVRRRGEVVGVLATLDAAGRYDADAVTRLQGLMATEPGVRAAAAL